MKNTFQFKFTLISIIIAAIAALAMTLIGSLNAIDYEKQQNLAYVKSLGDQYKLEVDGFMKYQKGYLEGHAQGLSNLGDYSPESVITYLYKLDEGNKFILYSYFNTLTDDGHFTSSDDWIPPSDYSWQDKTWVKRVPEMDEVYVDWPSYDRVTGQIVEVLRKKVVYDGKVVGILNMAIHLKDLSSTVEAFKLPEDGYAILMDPSGLIISYPDFLQYQNGEQAVFISDIEDSFGVTEEAFEIKSNFNFEGKRYIHVSLEDAPWHLYLVVPESYFSAGLGQIYLQYLVLYVVLCLFVFLFASLIGKRIMKPISKLTHYSSAIANGDYNLDIEEKLLNASNEIGRFANQFNKMKKEIQQREVRLTLQKREIEDLNINLEARIQERTQELQKTNQELNQVIQVLEKTQTSLVEAESLNLQSSLISGVAHELNTPIGTALTSLTYIQRETNRLLNSLEHNQLKRSELTKYLQENQEVNEKILNQLAKSSDIVQRIRMVSGTYMTDTKKTLPLNDMIHLTLESLATELESCHIQVHLEGDDPQLTTVPAAFGHVMTSLIQNVCHHAYSHGGPLYIKTFDGDPLSVHVIDQGMGSVETDLFEPFQTSKREAGHKGLGLSLVKNLVMNTLKGTIDLVPSDQGMHFQIKLPKNI